MTLGVGLLGAGRIAAVHAEAVALHAGSRLISIHSSHPGTYELAAKYGATVAPKIENIWEDPMIDAVIIATATRTHCDLIEEAIAAGKTVLCEKPLDLDLERVQQAWAHIGDEGSSRVRVGFNRRFDRDARILRDRVASGAVGRVQAVHIISRVVTPPPYRYVAESGGLFRDMTIHDFDLARFLVDEEPVRVYAAGSAFIDPGLATYGDIDVAKVLLEYQSGLIVSIENSRRSANGFDERVEIFGSTGLIATNIGGTNVVYSGSTSADTSSLIAASSMVPFAESFARQWAAFADAVAASDRLPGATFADGWRALSISIAAKQSLDEGRAVDIADALWRGPHR